MPGSGTHGIVGDPSRGRTANPSRIRKKGIEPAAASLIRGEISMVFDHGECKSRYFEKTIRTSSRSI